MTKEYIDFVEEGRELLKDRDTNAWAIGDLACEFIITVGRPKKGEDIPTLGDLANAWNCAKSSVSEWRSVSAFYPSDARTFDDDIISWTHYKLARSKSDDELGNALELLDYAQTQHLGTRAFERYLDGIFFEGEVQHSDLPEWLRQIVPAVGKLWITVQRMKE